MAEKGKMLSVMIGLAAVRHQGQFDKQGAPYILHCLKVLHYLKSDDEELQCAAVGHDLLEDTDVTPDELLGMGFTPRIVDAIIAVTKVDGEPYSLYKLRVMASEDAMRVKKADLRHNTDIRRLKGITPADMQRTMTYFQFYLEITARLCEAESRATSRRAD